MSPNVRGALLGAAIAIMLGALVLNWRARATTARSDITPVVASPVADPAGTLRDPLSPERLTTIDSAPRDASDWVSARPRFQYSRPAAERGGVEPCATPKVDASAFSDWLPLSKGHFSAPRDGALDASGGFDLVIHLLGDEPARRELVRSRQRFVLYTLTLDVSQSYAPLFSGTGFFSAIVTEIEQALGKRTGKIAKVRHVAASAWSAGFMGIEALLWQPESKDLDAIILIDGLHAPREPQAFKEQLKPFVDFSGRAAAGERFMLVTHSSIDPIDYASTTESAHYLVAAMGGKPQAVRRADALGLELVEYFSRGNFHVRGYAGNDKADHCAQLALLRDAYSALGRRWHGAQ
jgi:hypothetical protein